MSTDWKALCAELLQAVDEMPWQYDWKGNPVGPLAEIDEAPFARARAALAQPEPVGPTLDDIVELCADHEFILGIEGANEEESAKGLLEIARAVLAHWGRPALTPIPVSERLPGPEECDEHGRCWAWNPESLWWDYWQPKFIRMNAGDPYTHWLPGDAIPLPTP